MASLDTDAMMPMATLIPMSFPMVLPMPAFDANS
jgi:hypothetical protein